MISKKHTKGFMLALLMISTTSLHSMESSTSSSSFWSKLKTGLVALLLITGGAYAQQQNEVTLDSALPECILNQTRITLAAQEAAQTGKCSPPFCQFPYTDAYFDCNANEFHMSACANEDLAETLPKDLIQKASDKRASTVDFLIYKTTHKDEEDIRYLQYPLNQYTPDCPGCVPFNKAHYDQTVALTRETGKCELLCADPYQDCNKDGGGGIAYKRVYAYALCPQHAFDCFPDDCQNVIDSQGDEEKMAMGFLWNDNSYSKKNFTPPNTQLLECPMMRKPNQK